MISFFRNWYFNLRYDYKIKKANKELSLWAIRLKLEGLPAFVNMLSKFTWHADGLFEWIPTSPALVVARGWQDDCDGAAIVARWGFKQMGVACKIYRLNRSGGGHRVCVTDDHKYFTSNGVIITIPDNTTDWEKFILTWGWHKAYKYKSIKEV